jgi:hypothetical protein
MVAVILFNPQLVTGSLDAPVEVDAESVRQQLMDMGGGGNPWADEGGESAEAEEGVATVLDAQATQLSTWIASGARGQLVLNAPFNGGLVLQRGASAPTSGTGVTVVLRGTGDGNWRVVTGYPTP